MKLVEGRRDRRRGRDRRRAAGLPVERPRRAGGDRRGGARRPGALPRPTRIPGSRTGSPRRSCSRDTIASVECELRDGFLHLPEGPAWGSRSTSRRSSGTGCSARVPFAAVDPTNRNTALASALVEELARCGVRQAALAPGSRSTPLALALWRQPAIEVAVIVDERSAGYFALGAAQATGRPAAVLCTSGTAAANLHPAVCEADEAGVPLIVLTADRPAGAARDRRRADDRPAEALRVRGALVLRGRQPRGRRRRPAPLPLRRLPRLRRGPRGAAPGTRSPERRLARPAGTRAAPRGRHGHLAAGPARAAASGR